MSTGLHLVGVAFQFLTRIPVRVTGFDEADLRRSLGAFPLVGLAVAGVGVGVRVAGDLLWTPAVATVLAVLAMVAVTGAFHEDGLADAADGLWGGSDAERRLEIMRDSRLGTYGTVALVGALALRLALLMDLDPADFARAVVVGHVLGRASTLLVLRRAPLVPGSAAGLSGGPSTGAVTVAAVTVLLCLVTALGWWAPVPLVVAVLATIVAVRVAGRRLTALSGDVLGATNQVVHLSAMAATVAVVSA